MKPIDLIIGGACGLGGFGAGVWLLLGEQDGFGLIGIITGGACLVMTAVEGARMVRG